MTSVPIAASSGGANQVVAAAPGYKFRVLAWLLSFSGSVNAKWQSAANDMTGLFYGAAAAQAGSPALYSLWHAPPPGQFTTNPGEALNLNLSGATPVGGFVLFERIPANM